jgi:hypothetical protein
MVRTTYQEQLRPMPAQERVLDDVLWRCRMRSNAALKDIRADLPEYAALHRPVL